MLNVLLCGIGRACSYSDTMQVALTANDPAEATAGAGVIASFCEEYQEGQQMLAATFAPPTSPSTQQQGVPLHSLGCPLALQLLFCLDRRLHDPHP